MFDRIVVWQKDFSGIFLPDSQGGEAFLDAWSRLRARVGEESLNERTLLILSGFGESYCGDPGKLREQLNLHEGSRIVVHNLRSVRDDGEATDDTDYAGVVGGINLVLQPFTEQVTSDGSEAGGILLSGAERYDQQLKTKAAKLVGRNGNPALIIRPFAVYQHQVYPGGVSMGLLAQDGEFRETELLAPWTEGYIELTTGTGKVSGRDNKPICATDDPLAELYNTLLCQLRHYFQSTNLQGVTLGLSGGIDSALVAVLAADALGKGIVTAQFYPAVATWSESKALVKNHTERLGIGLVGCSLDKVLEQGMTILPEVQEGTIPHQNFIARLRANYVTTYANLKHLLVLSTSNASEIQLGYFTLYGDSCGGYAPLCHIPKTWVYRLVQWRNRHLPELAQGSPTAVPFSEALLLKPPSAELAFGQTDEQDLGMTYDEIDYYLGFQQHLPECYCFDEVKQAAVQKRRQRSAFKLRQLPDGPQISVRLSEALQRIT